MNTMTALDSRFKTGAYVREGETVYEVMGAETDDNGGVTGSYVLENIIGEYSASRTYVHRRVTRSSVQIRSNFTLVKTPAPVVVSANLEAQMNEHIRSTPDLAQTLVNGF